MKNVTKPDSNKGFTLAKSHISGASRRLIPIAALGFILLSLPLTGCFLDEPVQITYSEAPVTSVSVHIEEQIDVPAAEDGLPYGVTLQIDPEILVPCDLERVVDGDTIIVHDPDGNRLRVRLTGINAPESVHEDESRNTEEGRQASQFMKELLTDVDVVYLEYDEAQFDQYERTLAYVWIDIDGTYVMVNEILLATNYAEPVYIKPNLRYADVFRQYEG